MPSDSAVPHPDARAASGASRVRHAGERHRSPRIGPLLCAAAIAGATWVVLTATGRFSSVASSASETALLAAHASAITGRLRLAETSLRAATADLGKSAGGDARAGIALPDYFDAVVRKAADGSTVPLRGTGMAAIEFPAGTTTGGETLLATVPNAAGGRDVLMARAVNPAAGAADLLVARLAPGYLWQAGSPAPAGACVVASDGTLLDCPPGPLRTFLSATPATQAATAAESANAVELQAARIDLPVSGAQAPWQALVLHEAASNATGSPHLATLLAALLAGGLAYVLALTGLARRTGAARAPGASTIASGDAVPLQRTLAAMADIDQAILAGVEPGRLLAVGAAHLRTCCASPVALTVLDDPRTEQHTLAVADSARPREAATVRGAALLPRVGILLEANPQGVWCDRLSDLPFLAPLAAAGQRHAFVVPLFEDRRLAGAAALGATDRDGIGEACLAHARMLATRLSAALTAAQHARALYMQTHYDAATKLPNRRYLREHLGPQIARTRRDDKRLALLFVDLDGFKRVNAMAGHDHGDAILAEAAVRMRGCVREEDILARFGGDEFVLVLPRIADALDARKVADKLLATLARTYHLAGEEYRLGASIGISVFPDDAQSVDELLRHADFAMFRAKAAGRGQYAFYNDEVNRKADERNRLEAEIRRACEAGELTVHYQPQFNLSDGRLDGAEALVRWLHPQRGLVPPGAFMPVAEQSSLIVDIGDIVLRASLKQYSTWEAMGIAPPRVSVNVTGPELQRSDFADRVEAMLDAACLRPYCLELEITEGSLLNGSDDLLEQLERLRRRGVRIALDDFGTGYSSLSYLKRLPVDVVKIDRSFVRDIDHDNDAAAIARAIVDMAHSLGKSVIAEGIETENQRKRLLALGCEAGQGFLWSPALPAADLGQRFLLRAAATTAPV